MEAHAALPDIQHFDRMFGVVAQFVKQAISNASAQNDPHHPVGQQVVYVLDIPPTLCHPVSVGRMLQTAFGQEEE